MKIFSYKRSTCSLLTAFLATLLLVSCSQDDDQTIVEPPKPIIDNIEIGSGNDGVGVIGRDFHFEMDAVAGDLLETVQVKIRPQSGETYSHDWDFETTWDDYQGLKNTNVHKHFDIPEDAAEGVYDFIITVNDQNGAKVEEIREVELIDPANLPVDPLLYLWTMDTDQGDSHYVNELLESPENVEFSKNEVLNSMVFIQNVKGDGQVYLLLVKKSLNYFPETVEDIDFSKVIVYDVFQHENEEDVYTFSNVIFGENGVQERPVPDFTIGASMDNNVPQPNSITNGKAWETGAYYFGVVYTNFTHNISLHYYFELNIDGF
ncbi:DUF4625 domain-containing protein [Galbibacter sp. PAP.153]|uniref:DUF4625 domain-containing protein n=1 Tax=Galbibacter sp. PAP.153 TaxID=3104623 RepID=UPI00300980D8